MPADLPGAATDEVLVATSDDIVDGEVVGFEVAGEAIAIARSRGVLYAFEDRCSHQDCALSSGFVEDDQIECVWHGAMFDLATGAVTLPPAVVPIRTFEVCERQRNVFVRTQTRHPA
jgi:3-phenylpropionate/trans-cinnamate dioxygenase ferredoxin subunit